MATDQAAISSDSRTLSRDGAAAPMPEEARTAGGSAGGVRSRTLRALDQPAVDLLVDQRVVEQVEVVQPADAVHVVGREGQPVVAAGVAEGAARRDQQVAEQLGGARFGVPGQGREDDEVPGA